MAGDTRTARFWTGFALYVAFGVALLFIPMLRQLGYEASLATALFSGLVFPWVMPVFFGRLTYGTSPPAPLRTFRRMLLRQLGFLLLPLAALVAYGRVVPNCAPEEGVLFYLLMPVVTGVFFSALLTLLRTFLRRFVLLSYYLVLAALLLLPVAEILTRPQLFAYSHYFGMFAGVTWDEAQPPLSTLAVFRLLTLAYVLMMLAAAWMLASGSRAGRLARTLATAVFGTGLVAVLLLYTHASELGFSSSSAYTQRVLGASYESEHFTIWYPAKMFDDEDIRRVADEHEFRLHQVTRDLDVRWTGRITSYIYPDRATKRRLLGTESSQIARPWVREIHLSADGWSSSLKHELVHVVAGSFGPYINHAPFVHVLGLVEGLAMAVEWDYGNRSLHQYAAGMLAYGMLPRARDVLSTGGFLTHSSSVGYVASGSFTRWLMDSAGVDVVKHAYSDDDLLAATGSSWRELDVRWRSFLSTVPRELPDSIAVQYSFGHVPIFRKVCPRTVRELNRAAWEAFTGGRAMRAAQLYRQSDSLGANSAAAFGLVRSYYQLAEDDSVRIISGRFLADLRRTASVYPLLLWEGASIWSLGYGEEASECMEALLVERPAGWPVREAAWFAAALRDSASEALRPLLVDGLRWSGDVDSSRHVRLVALDSLRARGATPLAGLLKARLLLAADTALEEVVTLTAENQAVAPSLYFETGFMKLRALGRLGRWEEALIDAGRIRQRAVLYEDGAWLKDWEDRCRYFMTKSSDR